MTAENFVVTGYDGGFSRSSTRLDFIVSASSKSEAAAILRRRRPGLRKVSARPVSEFTELNPLTMFPRL